MEVNPKARLYDNNKLPLPENRSLFLGFNAPHQHYCTVRICTTITECHLLGTIRWAYKDESY